MEYVRLLWEFVILPLAAALGVRWLVTRTVESAKGGVSLAVGKALADHGKTISAEIESLKQALALDKERFSKDYALFAEQRNAIYANTLRAFELARGAYQDRFGGITRSTAFDNRHIPDVRALLATGLKFTSAVERERLSDLLKREHWDEAAKYATELLERDTLRRANRRFTQLRRAWVLHSLYFSAEVDQLLDESMSPFASLSVQADEKIEGEKVDWKRARDWCLELKTISDKLRLAMRKDMQEGFSRPDRPQAEIGS
jgi:hypothetical protein